jgi:hypothetical protein
MRDVYRDKAEIRQTAIADSEIVRFLAYKTDENARMSAWTDNNLIRVKNTYKKIMREAGLIKPDGVDLLITRPIVCDEIKAAWDKPDVYTAAMCLEV